MATEPTSAAAGGGYYYYPDTWTNATDSASNFGAGLPQFSTDVYNNWYNQPLTTGQTPWQTQAWGSMMDPTNEFINQTYDARAAMQGSQPYYGMAGNAYGQSMQTSQDAKNAAAGASPYMGMAGNAFGQAMNTVNEAKNAAAGSQKYYGQAADVYGTGLDTVGMGVNELGKVNPYLQGAANMYRQGATYDPNQLNQYLNPYMQGANQATVDASNRNLTENVLPGVNSTFAGAGQFGSSRNADFTNRAIRDQQQVLSETLGKQNYQNYATANQNYSDWADKGLQAAQGTAVIGGQQMQLGTAYGQVGINQKDVGQGFAGLGDSQLSYGSSLNAMAGTQNQSGQGYNAVANTAISQSNALNNIAGTQNQSGQGLGSLGNSQVQYGQGLGGLANQGAQMYQQNLNNMNTAATQQQQQMQGTLDANYKDWANQQQFPLSSFNTMAGGLGSLSGAVRPNAAGSAVPNMDSLTQTLNTLQTAGKSFSDPAVQNILQQLFRGA